MSRAILVTGAAGFAGSHLLDHLAAESADRRLVGWYRPGGRMPQQHGITCEAIDLLDRDAVRSALSRLKPELVYHCAGAAHVGQAWERTEATFAANVLGTHHLIDGLNRGGAGARVLIPSSALVYRPADEPLTENHALVPASPYGLSKLAQELVGTHSGPGGVQVSIA